MSRPAPAPTRPPAARHCFNCKFIRGITASWGSAICGNSKCTPIRPAPERGCSAWATNPDADPSITTYEQYAGRYGMPVAGFDDAVGLHRWPPPLAPARIRELYDGTRTPQARALAWEIARLQDVLHRLREALLLIAPTLPHCRARHDLERLCELIPREPGVSDLVYKAERARRGR